LNGFPDDPIILVVSQVAVGGQLQQLEREFYMTSAKTLEIQAECDAMEQQIKQLRAQH
jgi:hypothetical protein